MEVFPNGLTLEIHKNDSPAPIKVEPALVSLNDNTIPVILVNLSTECIELKNYQLKTKASPIPQHDYTVLVEVNEGEEEVGQKKVVDTHVDW